MFPLREKFQAARKPRPTFQSLRARCTIWQPIEAVGLAGGEIVLSFDDGPNPIDNTTARLLDTLAQEGVRGAFCVCGKCVRNAPELVHRMKIEGHMVVNHSYSHQPLAAFSERALQKEMDDCDAVIADAMQRPSYKTQLFRSACGWRTPMLDRVLARSQKESLPITDFGFDTNVTRHNYQKWVEHTLRVARRDRGGIFVLHDGRLRFWGERHYDPRNRDSSAYRGWVPEAAATLIRRCRAEGFRLVDPQDLVGRGSGTSSEAEQGE